MIRILLEIEQKLSELIQGADLKTMYIDYHKPYVKRIWFSYNSYRIYLHKIEPCNESSEALYHPHPWQSAIRILKGRYEMGTGHSDTNVIPATDCKLILPSGTLYEMLEKNSWHYVNPLDGPVYSLMVTGKLNDRPMPVEAKKTFRKLSKEEIEDILHEFKQYYQWHG
ncbi:MAG: hypothetical protein ACJ75J_08915 [Cytophagaceae bacterium]